jgi:ABC-type uncharacterized transport system permease subunit
MMERLWLIFATAGYGIAFVLALGRLRERLFRPSGAQFATFAVALALHTVFLIERGAKIGHCPLTNLLEVLAFLAWAIGVFYLVLGPLYHITLLGVLTAPLLCGLLVMAQVLPAAAARIPAPNGYWVELHASLTMMAYGALGLAALTGVVFLIQDHCLKRKRFASWIANLPALKELARVNRRILLLGLILLTAGLASGFAAPGGHDVVKTAWSALVWGLYVAIFGASHLGRLSGRKTALASAAVYVFVLLTFWGVNSLTSGHRML